MTEWKNRITRSGTANPKDLMPNPSNIKDHPEYQKKVMGGIMDNVGWVQTVVANETTGHIVDGHMRVELAIISGEAEIPVTYINVSEEEEKQLLLLFDPVSGLARQNKERIEGIIKTVNINSASAQDFIRNIAKKHKIDIRQYLDTGDGSGGVIEFPEGLDENLDQIVDGDVFEAYNPATHVTHRLMCGDCREEANWKKLLGDIVPVLAVTSPPYNQKIDSFKPSGMQLEHTAFVDRMADSYQDNLPEDQYEDQQVDIINQIGRHLSSNGSIFYNHKIRYREKKIVSPLEWILRADYPVRQEIIWDRGGSVTLNAKMFMPIDERIYWIRVGEEFIFNDETEMKTWSTIWKFAAKNDVRSSAAFAFELPYRCILACSKPGDAVIDPYSGTGTTIVAANRTKRVGFGFEINPKYVKQSIDRLSSDGLIVTRKKDNV